MPMQTEREKQILQINRQAMDLLGDLDNMDKIKALLGRIVRPTLPFDAQ